MTSLTLTTIVDAITALDPDKMFVALDIDAETVKYHEDIVLHEKVSPYHQDEEVYRAFVVAWLCTEGGYLPANLELEKRYSIGRPRGSRAELDILINRPNGDSFALVEVKTFSEYDDRAKRDEALEHQLFAIAPHEPAASVVSLVTVATGTGEKATLRAISVDVESSSTYDAWNDSGRSAARSLPNYYGDARPEHFVKGGTPDLHQEVTREELSRIRKRLHDVLWGGSGDDNTIYDHLVRLLLAKIHDEVSTAAGSRYKFQRYHTASGVESVADTFDRINSLYERAYVRYLAGGADSTPKPLDPEEFSHEQIAFVVEQLEGVSLTGGAMAHSDVLGDFFEAITQQGFKQSKGLFFTHLNIAVFIVQALELPQLAAERMGDADLPHDERLPYVIDPSCGAGTFLLAAMRMITAHIEENREQLSTSDDAKRMLERYLPPSNPNQWADNFLWGIDSYRLLAMSTKVNMILHRDGNSHVYFADGLAPFDRYVGDRLKAVRPAREGYEKQEVASFDAVISNPPFSIKLATATSANVTELFELAPDKNSENLFLERWYQLLKPGGRLGVVMPESFFGTSENQKAREFLLDRFDLRAVVSLPRLAFEPWTPTKTSLLFATRKTIDDEIEWRTWRLDHEAGLAEAKRTALRLLRRVKRAASDGPTVVGDVPDEANVEQYEAAIEMLGVDVHLESGAVELDVILENEALLKSVDVTGASFAAASVQFSRTVQLIHVDNIGYKRTKRAEQVRPNELFHAVNDAGVPVLNLNRSADQWTVEVDGSSADDALSYLSAAGIWE